MTVQEISNRLDTLLNKSSRGIVLDEYVKSFYLTQVQSSFVERVLKMYEYTDRMRHLIGPLLVTKTPTISLDSPDKYKVDLESGIKQIVYEVVDKDRVTIPLDWNDIHYTIKNPFREPDPSIAYRVTFDKIAYLYAKPRPIKYTYVYCKIPKPIVLQKLPDGLELQGVTDALTSELPDDVILQIIEETSQIIIKNKSLFAEKKEK